MALTEPAHPLPRGYARARAATKRWWAAVPHERLTALGRFHAEVLLRLVEAAHRTDDPALARKLRAEIRASERDLGMPLVTPTSHRPQPRRTTP